MIEPNAKQSAPELNDWYAVYTRHQHEKAVAQNFARNGLEVFLPLYGVVRQWKDRTKHLSLPLFPCYVFFRGGIERRVSILSIPGIHSIVTMGTRPAPIPTAEIEAIRTAVNSPLRVEPHPFLRCGERVRLRTGPLAGVEGILLRKKNIFRLILSTTLLERSVAVEVDADCVEPVAPWIAVPPITTQKVNGFGREPVLG
jgi:transcription termination/antitermination protein NusG